MRYYQMDADICLIKFIGGLKRKAGVVQKKIVNIKNAYVLNVALTTSFEGNSNKKH